MDGHYRIVHHPCQTTFISTHFNRMPNAEYMNTGLNVDVNGQSQPVYALVYSYRRERVFMAAHQTDNGHLRMIYYVDNDRNFQKIHPVECMNLLTTQEYDLLNSIGAEYLFGNSLDQAVDAVPLQVPPGPEHVVAAPQQALAAPAQVGVPQAGAVAMPPPNAVTFALRKHNWGFLSVFMAVAAVWVSIVPIRTNFWVEIPFCWEACAYASVSAVVYFKIHEMKQQYNGRYLNNMMRGGLETLFCQQFVMAACFAVLNKVLYYNKLPTITLFNYLLLQVVVFMCNLFGVSSDWLYDWL